MSDRDLEQLLNDPTVRSAFGQMAKHRKSRELCPDCGRNPLPASADWCDDCTADRHRAAKAEWWNRQGDYAEHIRDGLRPVHAAKRWLAHRLRRGPVRCTTVIRDATADGISERTLRRAREQLQDVGRLAVDRGADNRGGTATWRLTTREERGVRGHLARNSKGDSDRLAAPDDGGTLDQEQTT